MALFSDVPLGPVDPMFDLKKASDADLSPEKIDLGIGVYRGEERGYYEFKAVRQAKQILDSQNPGHDYNPTTGIKPFVDGATSLLFGDNSDLIRDGKIASIQTVAGTGAVRLAAAFLNRNYPSHSNTIRSPNPTKVYIGTPAWANYTPLFQHAGFSIENYVHYDAKASKIDFQAALDAIADAPKGSIFVYQACCHNPTGQDYSEQQWRQLASAIKQRQHFVFFDIAYQGLATDMDTDAWCVRHFASEGIDLLACQSFSKHMGLYSERVGALHVVCRDSGVANHVGDQLRSLIRWEVSSCPAYGARLAAIILHDERLRAQWLEEVQAARTRLANMRQALHSLLTVKYKTPGDWKHIVEEKGLFSMLALSRDQIDALKIEYHAHFPYNGRINIAGLNEGNVERFAVAVDELVRRTKKNTSSPEVESRL